MSKDLPSREKAIASTGSANVAKTPRSRPVSGSHRRIVRSWPAVKTTPSSGEIARRPIGERWPSGGKRSLPVATSHSLTTSSAPVVTSVLPSGEKATELIRPRCAWIWRNSSPRGDVPEIDNSRRRKTLSSRLTATTGEGRAVGRKRKAIDLPPGVADGAGRRGGNQTKPARRRRRRRRRSADQIWRRCLMRFLRGQFEKELLAGCQVVQSQRSIRHTGG